MPLSRPVRSLLATVVAVTVGAALSSGASPAHVAGSESTAAGGEAPSTPATTGCASTCDVVASEVRSTAHRASRVTLDGRVIDLVLDDTGTATGVISDGSPDDQVWLDRTRDNGASWDSRLVGARIAASARRATTPQVATSTDPAPTAVRACGKVGNRRAIACTGWVSEQRTARTGTTWDRAAIAGLMRLYDRRTGLWPSTGWWNSANALTSLIDYMIATHDRRDAWVVANTFDRNRSTRSGDFAGRFLDDTGWWALAWIRAYDLTHRHRYLRMAEIDVAHMWDYHDGRCGGGLWWTTSKQYKNAITNELFIKAAAELHSRVPGDRRYLRIGLATWRWFEGSGLINDQHLVADGIDAHTCRSNSGTAWSYNQGVILGGLVALARATHHGSYLREAKVLADASTVAPSLNVRGVLTEPCEADGCGADGPTFKGAYVRNLGELADRASSTSYRAYLLHNADVAHRDDRTPRDLYGSHWRGPIDHITGATQQSAVDLMVAALH